ncbi:hypothetical protein [Microcoleus sp. D3_18a_C4]|uniref:hypothetical protein n=1 Tax=Microcoleus sp. D3_18a_C4 TaxID=3055332 RepID=UPI002FCF8348
MEILETWAGQEFLTVPQLTRVVVKRAIAEYLKQHPLESENDTDCPPDPQPTEVKPATAAKAKRGKASKGAS